MDYPKSVEGVGLVDGQFVDEDKATARPGSLIPAKWGNDVTNELLSVIKAAGLAPSEEQSNQLLAAIRRLRGGAGNFGLWGWNTATAGSPGVGRLSLGAVDPTGADQLIIAEVSGEDMDYAGPLSLLRAGDTISVQTRDSAEFSHRYRVTGDPVDNGAYRTIPVTHVSGTGAAPADNVVLSVLFTQAGASDSSVPVGTVMWWPDRRSIPKGFGPGDGQALQRSLYPDLTKMANGNMLPLATDANWWATPTERGKYTLGDGATTIRLPDYNGKSQGSLGALFQRGDGALSAAIAGVIQMDAMQGHHHSLVSPNNLLTRDATSWAAQNGTANPLSYAAAPTVGDPIGDGKSGAPRTATETRSLNVTGCWIIKLFGTVSNEGAADAAALATVYAALVGRVEALEARPFVVEWESLPLAITTGGRLNVSHTLKGRPKLLQGVLRCRVANNGFVVGEEIQLSQPIDSNGANSARGCQLQADANRVVVQYGASTALSVLVSGGGWLEVAPTNAFDLIVRAWI